MSRFRPSQRTVVTTAIIFGLVAWSVLRAIDTRRKDRQIERLESQVRSVESAAARWRATAQRSSEINQQQTAELTELRAALEAAKATAESPPAP